MIEKLQKLISYILKKIWKLKRKKNSQKEEIIQGDWEETSEHPKNDGINLF